MEVEGFLAALHYVYLPVIYDDLKIWSHRLRTTRSLPIRMWVSGQLQSPLGIELVGSIWGRRYYRQRQGRREYTLTSFAFVVVRAVKHDR